MRRAGLPVLEYLPDRNKVSRVYASTPIMESGRLYIPRGKEWAGDLHDEALAFPNGAHDDQVDAMTMAIQYMRDSWNVTHPEDPDWEDDVNPRRIKGLDIGEPSGIIYPLKFYLGDNNAS